MQGKIPLRKIALLHFLPLELYPPVMNFINSWSESNSENAALLNVYTTPCSAKELVQYKSVLAQKVKIKRFGFRLTGKGLIKRLAHYLLYYGGTLLRLIATRPDTVFYYDSISSFPAWCYKTFFKKSCRVFIHYHEYMSKQEYSGGMVLLKWFHQLEMKLYGAADWVSHTNKERMHFFAADLPGIEIKNKYILPNYPPQNWKSEKKTSINYPVRFIQIGSLGIDSMYTTEFAEWIIRQDGKATWDIYALIIEESAMDFLTSLQSTNISFKGKVNYEELPAILKQYDVGVILYKGHIPNYIYNAPNKMFEYYTCGLDTWLPAQMVTASQYATIKTFPKIIPVVFENLSLYMLDEMISREGLQYQHGNYSAEQALIEIINKLDKPTAN